MRRLIFNARHAKLAGPAGYPLILIALWMIKGDKTPVAVGQCSLQRLQARILRFAQHLGVRAETLSLF